jgi:prepilin-type processing-associated H-X9-DG protein
VVGRAELGAATGITIIASSTAKAFRAMSSSRASASANVISELSNVRLAALDFDLNILFADGAVISPIGNSST